MNRVSARLVITAFGAVACTSRPASTASAPSPATGTAADLEMTDDPTFNISLSVLLREPADTVNALPAKAWSALPQVYRALGLSIGVTDAASQSVASPLLRIHQFLGRVPLSRFLSCGRSAYGDNADVQ